MAAPCVADLVRANGGIREARRLAEYLQRYPAGLDLDGCIVLVLCDSGHANGQPERDEIMRYRSVGGYFLLVVERKVLLGLPGLAALMDWRSSQTQRVCRSTLAAEAAHLSESLESAEWLCVLLDECLNGNTDLKEWMRTVSERDRVYVTDAQSVYDYVTKESSSVSKDKRMAIEGALLREAVRQPRSHMRWFDGTQNFPTCSRRTAPPLDYFRATTSCRAGCPS